MVTLCNLEHSAKVSASILITPSDNVKFTNSLHLPNAFDPIFTAPPEIIRFVNPLQPINA